MNENPDRMLRHRMIKEIILGEWQGNNSLKRQYLSRVETWRLI